MMLSMLRRAFLAALASLALAAPAFALPSLAPRVEDKQVRLGLFTNSYLTSGTESISDDRTGNLALSIGVRALGNNDNFHFGVDADGLYGLRKSNYRYISIAEAYAGYEAKEFNVYFGRKRYLWNELDSLWGMGLYQPRFRWDYLNDREIGLFGLFASHESEFLQVTAYATPLFIPEQGAPFDIANGNCTSSSPWFSCPASSIAIFNQNTDVRFSLSVPPIKTLALNPGGGITARVGRSLGYFARASYAHKPINQFYLSYEGNLDLATLEVPAVIRPRVLYHDLVAGEAGWISKDHAITASAIYEKPHPIPQPASYNTQEGAPALLHGITVKSAPFKGPSFSLTRFEASYLHRNGGNAADKGPFAQPSSQVFEPRYAFKNAFSFAVFTPVFDSWARTFLFTTRFVVDTINRGNILQSDIYVRPLAAAYVNFGVDILGSDSRSAVDFISRYQANDRLRAGVTYAF